MEYIYGNADKYKTRIMEEYARAFYREMQFIAPISKSIKGFFRILRCCDDKVICYRHIDESLKEELENMNNGCSKMNLEKNWIIYSEGAFIKYGRTIYCGNFSIVKNIPNTLYVRWIKNAIADKIGSGLL